MKTIRHILTPLVVLLVHSVSRAQTPLLNSYPAAKATVYLDFSGALIEGTAWNWNGPIRALPAELPRASIVEIFTRIAEDFRPFNLNITTDPAVYERAPRLQKTRIIFTPTSDWYGYAGGVALVGSFSWGDETPAWVFSELLDENPKYIAACASHQIGHTLGLQHQSVYDNQCHKLTECEGSIPGLSGWAPIMGIGLYQPCTTWQKGPSTVGCGTIQDDLAVIAGSPNNFGFRRDDYGDDYTKAEKINFYGQEFSVRGLINSRTDRDAFSMELSGPSEILIQAAPEGILDDRAKPAAVCARLLNGSGKVIGRYNAAELFDTGIQKFLQTGTYFLILEYGNRKHAEKYFRPQYYALSGRLLPASDIQQFALLRKAH
jgi:hypothetical protein